MGARRKSLKIFEKRKKNSFKAVTKRCTQILATKRNRSTIQMARSIRVSTTRITSMIADQIGNGCHMKDH